jgi:3-oxoacyl-[acyl-carrier protein] reductase
MVTKTFSPADDWKNVWQYNLGIGHELNRAFIPDMVQKKWGRIVHLSTNSTKTGHGYPASVCSKFAIDGYVSTVNREVAKDGVVICAVAPGTILTEGRYFAKLQKEDPAKLDAYLERYVPARKLGTVENIGNVVAFLCSEHAFYMSGAIVRVDGGGM